MDFASILTTAAVSTVFSGLVALVGFKLLAGRIRARISAEMSGFVHGLLNDASANPENYAKALKPMLDSLIAQYTKGMPAGAMAAGADGAMGGLSAFIPRKYRFLAPLAEMFMKSRSGKTENAQGASPFDQ